MKGLGGCIGGGSALGLTFLLPAGTIGTFGRVPPPGVEWNGLSPQLIIREIAMDSLSSVRAVLREYAEGR
jgi:hypothetical protein